MDNVRVAKVRHGDMRVHGLASLPNVAETQVRADGDGADAEKIAVTFSSEFIATRQVPLPVQAPFQLLKVAPDAGVAVSITDVPLA